MDLVGGAIAAGDEDLGAGIAQGGHAVEVCFGRGDHEHRGLVESSEELAVERQACLGVEDDAERLARVVRPAGGEQGVVGEDGADADCDRVGFGAPAVDESAALLARDPRALAGSGRGLAVERTSPA